MEVGGAPAENFENWQAPEIVEPALKYTALTFRKTFNTNNKIDFLQRLKEVIHSMRPIIEGQTQINAEAVKWYLTLKMNFCESTSPGVKTDPDPAATFCSGVFNSIEIHGLDYHFHVGYNQIVMNFNVIAVVESNGDSTGTQRRLHVESTWI